MMDNKDIFIKATDKVKPTERLKRLTKNKILESKENGSRTMALKLANVMIVILLVFSVIWVARENQDKTNEIDKIINNTSSVGTKISSLPTVDSKENLKKLLENLNENSRNSSSGFFGDTTTKSQSAADSYLSEGTTESANSLQDYSETNEQVEGVSEADIVKTDGEYIYYLTGNKLVIVDCKNPSSLKILKEINYKDLNVNTSELFIRNDKLVVIGNKYEYNNTLYSNEAANSTGVARDMIYPYYNNTSVVAFVYDISSKEDIKLLREVSAEGSYLSARMIDDDIYLVSNKYVYTYYGGKEVTDDNLLRPAYKDTAISDEKCFIDYSQMCYFPDNITDSSYLIIIGFSIDNKNPAHVSTYLGAGNTIYSSTDNLYVAKSKYTYNLMDQAKSIIGINSYDVKTQVFKFALNNGKTEYVSNGEVPGTILNQFSMDEYKENFRIATTVNTNWNNESQTNNMYILDKNLNVIGKIEDLAKGERIYSVRFMQDKGYIVTYRQVDPLFAIDLSNPEAPKVLGELKIPGYSSYLHPYDETHLIGIGVDTEVVNYGYGEQTVNKGMKMSLFDITDMKNPKELYSVNIGGNQGTSSEILYNHKALLFSKEKDIIAFPVQIPIYNGQYYNGVSQKAVIYGLSIEEGFKLKGEISHNNTAKYDYTREIQRILYIDDAFFTVSQGLIKATDMNTMNELGNVSIQVNQNIYPIMEDVVAY